MHSSPQEYAARIQGPNDNLQVKREGVVELTRACPSPSLLYGADIIFRFLMLSVLVLSSPIRIRSKLLGSLDQRPKLHPAAGRTRPIMARTFYQLFAKTQMPMSIWNYRAVPHSKLCTMWRKTTNLEGQSCWSNPHTTVSNRELDSPSKRMLQVEFTTK